MVAHATSAALNGLSLAPFVLGASLDDVKRHAAWLE